MTGQIDDCFRYDGTKYSVAGISEGQIFDPAWLGLTPVSPCTACWRGYQAIYTVIDRQLVIETLCVSLPGRGSPDDGAYGPPINGLFPQSPENPNEDFFNNHYIGLNYPLHYTGGMLIADGFFWELYDHMGFQAAWKYAIVVELIFVDGRLEQAFKRSDRMAAIREEFEKLSSSTSIDSWKIGLNDFEAYVKQSFDRRYRF
ncbi:MAG: hypothetical protein U0795_00455 [Pirellulales bacterium]